MQSTARSRTSALHSILASTPPLSLHTVQLALQSHAYRPHAPGRPLLLASSSAAEQTVLCSSAACAVASGPASWQACRKEQIIHKHATCYDNTQPSRSPAQHYALSLIWHANCCRPLFSSSNCAAAAHSGRAVEAKTS